MLVQKQNVGNAYKCVWIPQILSVSRVAACCHCARHDRLMVALVMWKTSAVVLPTGILDHPVICCFQ